MRKRLRRRTKEIFIHILPVLLGIVITAVLSTMVYHQMMIKEEEASWEQLESVALSVAEKITIRFEDSMNLMVQVADAISMKDEIGKRNAIFQYLKNVQESTIFERVDILLPNNTVIHQDGKIHEIEEGWPDYEDLVSKGPHYSGRNIDQETKRPVIYCAVPIITDAPEGVLIGMIDCMGLSNRIQTYSFGGTAQVFLVDQADGSFLIDNWNSELGNIHEMDVRKKLKDYEDVPLREELLAGITGHTAFYSEVNGKASYMSYVPVEGFNWTVAVAAQEDEVLKNVHQLSQTLLGIAVVECCLLLSYLVWNIFVASLLVKQRESVQKMKLDAATNQAKALFLSTVSHDIRTPLNGILGMLDVIKARKETGQQLNESLDKIRISAEYLVTLANNVLDLNELESGKAGLEDEHIDLRKLKSEMDILVQPKLKDSGVTYHMSYGVLEHPFVLGSDGYLHRILFNLVGNSIKYNKEGGSVWVTVEEQEPQDGSSLYRFTVRDNGIGMSEEFLGRMFTAFEQEQGGARSANKGHGLGLAIVDRMVRKMDGSIQVESKKGEGTAFFITIPFRWDPEGEGREKRAAAPKTVSGLPGANILLVEDNELNLEIAKILLEEAGAVITAAANGRLAVEAFQAAPDHYDAILMDVMMPEMDGIEATKIIRAMDIPSAGKIPIIAMTANTFAEDIKRCKDAGMNEHVAKPLNMETLTATISALREAYRNGT